MADPTKYERSFDFSNFQASKPKDPPPGAAIDVEFEQIQTAIDELVAALKDIRRSDGQLVNGIVTLESFAPGVELMGKPGKDGVNGANGANGWAPVLGIVSDGARRVIRVTDWIGGTGSKPAVGGYIGPSGFVSSIAQATDIRGPVGPAGTGGGTTPPPDPVPVLPVNQVLPAISGTMQQGQTLTGTDGTWSGSPTEFTRQWKRNGAAISGAINSTYLLGAADVGAHITFAVTATNAAGPTTETSLATPAIAALTTVVAPENTSLPVITGQPVVGQTLTGSDGSWSNTPTGFSRQWRANGAPISNANGPTYVVTQANQGAQITFTVTANNAAGPATATSLPTAPVSSPSTATTVPIAVSAPVISGPSAEAATLTATPGVWRETAPSTLVPVAVGTPVITGDPVVGETLSVNPNGAVGIEPADLAGTAVSSFTEEWDSIDLWTSANPGGRWATGYHWYPPEGGSLNGSMEQQWYIAKEYAPTASVIPWTVAGGVLSLTADRMPEALKQYTQNYQYSSGMLTTYRSFTQKRGYWEARLKMPGTPGFFPAFWLIPSDGSWPPEIDIVEFLSNNLNTYFATTHWSSTNQQLGEQPITPDLSAAFHDYGVLIEDDFVSYYFDKVRIAQHPMQPDMLDKAWYAILNLAVGGWNNNVPAQTTVFPSSLQCEYIRAYTPAAASWLNAPTSFAIQWMRDGVDIDGANGTDYVLVEADDGAVITAEIIATNSAGPSDPVLTEPTAAVTGGTAPGGDATGMAWNPEDQSSATLTNDNRTIQNSEWSGTGARTDKAITGKRYFEVQVDGGSGDFTVLGFSDPSQIADPYDGPGMNAGTIGWQPNGDVIKDWAGVNGGSNIPTPNLGECARFCVDETARKLWICTNTNAWNGRAEDDPVTGVGGIDIPAGDLFLHIKFTAGGNQSDIVTLNTLAAEFVFAAPTGFTEIP